MNKKNYFLIGLVLVLAGVYAFYFTDWFKTKTIHISCTSRPVRAFRTARTAQPGAATSRLIFSLQDDYELTEIKVVSLDALKTNKLAQPAWHLIGDPSSDSINLFTYGQTIDGMNPAVAGTRADPIQPGVMYRISITDGKIKGHLDFHIGAAPANTATNR
jgi:hypothetical protein